MEPSENTTQAASTQATSTPPLDHVKVEATAPLGKTIKVIIRNPFTQAALAVIYAVGSVFVGTLIYRAGQKAGRQEAFDKFEHAGAEMDQVVNRAMGVAPAAPAQAAGR